MTKTSTTIASVILLSLSSVFLFLVGIYGVGRAGDGGFDSNFLHVAGVTWLKGTNAYELSARAIAAPEAAAEVYAFAYPPNIFPFAAFLGLFSADASWWAMNAINAICLVIVLVQSVKVFRQYGILTGVQHHDLAVPVLLSAILTLPFTAHMFFMGQTSLIVLAALMLFWNAYLQRRILLSGALLAIAMIKPQLGIFIVLWLIFERQWRILSATFVFGFLYALSPLLISGSAELLTTWVREVLVYRAEKFNAWGGIHMFGIPSLFHNAGLSNGVYLFVGSVLTYLIWLYRTKFCCLDIFSLLIACSLLFAGVHNYDLVALVPLISVLFARALREHHVSIPTILLVVVIYVPQRWLRDTNIDLLLEYRVFSVILLLIALTMFSYKDVCRFGGTKIAWQR